MKEKSSNSISLAILGAFLLVIGYGSAAFAQTAAPKPSDYATDVQAGQAAIQNDPAVASNAKEVNDSESDEGDVDNEPAEVQEAVEPQEATEAAETSESGESSGGESSDGESSGNESGSGQESSGGTNGGTSGGER